jgi:hypothetical protein
MPGGERVKISCAVLEDERWRSLSDLAWRVGIELHLLENKSRKDYQFLKGQPSTMAWWLRHPAATFEAALSELRKAGLLMGVCELVPLPQVNRGRLLGVAWRKLREVILRRDHRTCQYCGMGAAEVDHVIPLVRGGDNDPGNLAAACRSCNRRKHTKTAEEFREQSRVA